MPPVLGPVSPSPTRLWSCAEPKRQDGRCRRSARRSWPPRRRGIPRSPPGAGAPKRPPNMSSIAASASVARLGDGHALAGGEAVGLDHDRRAEAVERGRAPRGVGEARIAGGRDAGAVAQLLGEALASLRAAPPPASARTRRCPAARRLSASPSTSGASGPITTRSIACVARRTRRPPHDPSASSATQLGHAPRCPDCRARRTAVRSRGDCASFQRERMFAPARADQQDVHGRPSS